MATDKDLVEIAAKIKKNTAEGTEDVNAVLDLLSVLETVQVTRESLKVSNIGVVVGKLRKDANATVAEKSRALVEKWRRSLKGQAATPKDKPAQVQASTSSVKADPSAASPKSPPPVGHFGGPVEVSRTGNATRDKVRQNLGDILQNGKLGEEIEDELFQFFKEETDRNYVAKVRSLLFNLRDKKNPIFREKVAHGIVTPAQLCTLTPADMASEDMRAVRQKLEDKSMFEADRSQNSNAAMTDMFKCGKCGKRKCSYFQMQTRSADEPMTVFVTCMNCGNRWKQ